MRFLEKKHWINCETARILIETIAPDITFTGLLNRPIDFSQLEIGEVIGKGSFGKVSRATYCQETVAVKELERDAMSDVELLRDFQKELWIGWY